MEGGIEHWRGHGPGREDIDQDDLVGEGVCFLKEGGCLAVVQVEGGGLRQGEEAAGEVNDQPLPFHHVEAGHGKVVEEEVDHGPAAQAEQEQSLRVLGQEQRGHHPAGVGKLQHPRGSPVDTALPFAGAEAQAAEVAFVRDQHRVAAGMSAVHKVGHGRTQGKKKAARREGGAAVVSGRSVGGAKAVQPGPAVVSRIGWFSCTMKISSPGGLSRRPWPEPACPDRRLNRQWRRGSP